MMKLTDKDIFPDTDCRFVATGETATDVAKKMMSHMKSEHPDLVKDMNEAEMMKKFESMTHM